MFKILREKASSFTAMHSRLVAFGISAAIVTGLMVGLAALTDSSHMAYARKCIGDGWSC
jgi:hypothetical protein